MSGCVVTLGSINVDLLARVARLPIAGETIAGESVTRLLGGKGANQAVAVARAEVRSILLGAVGDDPDADLMVEALARYDVETDGIARVPGSTGCALVVTSPQDNQIVVVAGANAGVNADASSNVRLGPDVVCLTQMETPAAAAEAFFARARAVGATTMLNAAPASRAVLPLLALADILVVNESELALLSGRSIPASPPDAAIADALRDLADRPGIVIVTLGAEGVVVARGAGLHHIPGQAARVVDTTGAGDCFCGYLAAGLARGDSLESAAVEANVAASVAVQSLGAASSVPLRSTILPALSAAQPRGV